MKIKGWIDEPYYSEIKNSIPIPCVDLLVLHNNRLLLMKRTNSPAKGIWFTPGGRVFRGECLEDAVKRVLEKETGHVPLCIKQIGAMSHIWSEVHTVTVFFIVEVDSEQVLMNNEHEEYRWINGCDSDLHPYLKHMIMKSQIFSNVF